MITLDNKDSILSFKVSMCGWCTHSGRPKYSDGKIMYCYYPYQTKTYVIDEDFNYVKIDFYQIAKCKLGALYEHIDHLDKNLSTP